MTDFNHDAVRWPLIHGLLYNTPLMIDAAKADVLHHVVQGYAAGQPPAIDAAAFAEARDRKPYTVTSGGVAILPVLGSLTHRGGVLHAMSGLTSYRYLHAMLRQAEADGDVRGILLELDSPGGSADGLFELADHVRQVAQNKPVWGIVNEQAFSACYAIAASCDRVLAPKTGMVGSIGVIMMHLDISAADAKAGRKYTPIYAGFHKADGSMHAPLSDSALATYQGLVDHAYGVFVEHVAAGRGLAVDDVVATEAQVFHAEQALALGLVDQVVAGFDAGLQIFEGSLASRAGSVSQSRAAARNLKRGKSMSDNNQIDDAEVITQADLDAARDQGREEGYQDGHDAGMIDGRQAEADRVASILGLEAAEGRIDPQLAVVLSRGMAVADAEALLACAPAAGQGGDFAAAMSALGNPEVGVAASQGGEVSNEQRATRAVSLIQGRG